MIISSFFYNFSVAFTKISTLLFYRRIFELHKSLAVLLIALIVIVFCFLALVVWSTFFYYKLLEARWKPWIPHTTVMADERVLGYVLGIINSVLDVILLIIPQNIIWRLQWSGEKKLLVAGVFIVGGM